VVETAQVWPAAVTRARHGVGAAVGVPSAGGIASPATAAATETTATAFI
jgi:hypothetical protein